MDSIGSGSTTQRAASPSYEAEKRVAISHQQRANETAREHSDIVHNTRAALSEHRARLMAEVEDIDYALRTVDPLCKAYEAVLDAPTTAEAPRPY